MVLVISLEATDSNYKSLDVILQQSSIHAMNQHYVSQLIVGIDP